MLRIGTMDLELLTLNEDRGCSRVKGLDVRAIKDRARCKRSAQLSVMPAKAWSNTPDCFTGALLRACDAASMKQVNART
jgi:hypothetical protein